MTRMAPHDEGPKQDAGSGLRIVPGINGCGDCAAQIHIA